MNHGIRFAAFVVILAAGAACALAQGEDDVIINEFTVNPSTGKEYVELLVVAPVADLRGWTLSDVFSRTQATGTTEGDITFTAALAVLAAVPQGTYIVVELATPSGNASTLAEDLSLTDATPRRLVITAATAGVTAGGTMDISTNENLHLFRGDRASGALVDQVLAGNNQSYIDGAAWGDNAAATLTDNINRGTGVPSKAAVRFVPLSQLTPDDFRQNDSGGVYAVDTLSYGTPGAVNTGVNDACLRSSAAESPQPAAFSVTVFPQPLRAGGALRVALDRPEEVSISIVDVRGSTAAVVCSGTPFPAGETVIPLPAISMPPGMYVARVQTRSGMAAARLLVTR
jgi:hypothetical protein